MEDRRSSAAENPVSGIVPRCQQLLIHGDERLDELLERAGAGHPIVHLDVDVRRVGAVPVREILMVPNPLQIRRLGVWPGRGDKQISAEIEHRFRQYLQTMRFLFLIRAKDRRER